MSPWSSKIIPPQWTGPRRVDIVSEHGRLLLHLPFELK